jgi:alkyl hydroperoxide reductase subunit AhpC
VAISADTRDKAETEVSQEGWTFPVGYDLTLEQMRRLGVYISEPRSPLETDRPFAEPGLFVVNPDGRMQIIDISNAPAARPALSILLLGLQFIMKNDRPVRGTLA